MTYSLSKVATALLLSSMATSQVIAEESDTSEDVIRANDFEDKQPGLNDRAIKKLTADHAGTYLHVNDLDSLSFSISTEKHWEEISKILITRKSYWLIAFMFLLLCADWIIRKRSGGM